MELENFRRHWQQPVTPPASPDEAALARLLARSSYTPVARMRRNIRAEIRVIAGCLASCLVATAVSGDRYYLLAAAWVGLIGGLSSWYFWRKVRILNAFEKASGQTVRQHLAQQLKSLRRLVRLYQRATLWALPASAAVAVAFVGGRLVQSLATDKLPGAAGALVGAVALVGGLTYVGTRRFAHAYVQGLYGQHLDHLQASLRELTETDAGASPFA